MMQNIHYIENICYHAEQLRKYFVDFEGKETITVSRLDLLPETATVDDWRGIISKFPAKLKTRVKGNLVENVEFNFHHHIRFQNCRPCYLNGLS